MASPQKNSKQKYEMSLEATKNYHSSEPRQLTVEMHAAFAITAFTHLYNMTLTFYL